MALQIREKSAGSWKNVGFEQSDFFSDQFEKFGFPIEATAENLALVRAFLLEKWKERHIERYGSHKESLNWIPVDLSNSCKFTALFGSVVFGGDITGNYEHMFNVVNGKIVDINQEAKDVQLFAKPHKIDKKFLAFNEELYQSLKSCAPRVEGWINEFAAVLEAQANPVAQPV